MTPHDRYQRLIDLKGEIKQADDLVAECERSEGDKLKALQLASEAAIKQRQSRAELYEEARRLAKEASEDFLSLVPNGPSPSDPPPLAIEDGPAPEMIVVCDDDHKVGSDFWNPAVAEGADFQAQALQNGLHRIHDALDRNT